eukprot:SAG25_NODE_527_length_7183_cov_5.308018_2_plen_139_part_00
MPAHTRSLERSLGRKVRVESARNGIPYVSGGDKHYPSPEYRCVRLCNVGVAGRPGSLPDLTDVLGACSEGFYGDYSVPSSVAWAKTIEREARKDPTKHAHDHSKPPQRMTWKLRRQLEEYQQEMEDVKGLDASDDDSD